MAKECKNCGVLTGPSATFCYGCGNPMPKQAPVVAVPTLPVPQTQDELKLDCSACKTPSIMTARNLPRFSSILRFIGFLLVVPSFLGIAAGVLMILTSFLGTAASISSTSNSSAQGGAVLGMIIGMATGLSVALLALVSGAAGWVLLLDRNVWKCERCGYFLDRA